MGNEGVPARRGLAGVVLGPRPPPPFPEITTAIAHLREVLSDQTYELLAHEGESMTTAAMMTYAYDQIDQARAERTQSRSRRWSSISLVGLPLNGATAWNQPYRTADREAEVEGKHWGYSSSCLALRLSGND